MAIQGAFTALSPQCRMSRPEPAVNNPANSDATVCHEPQCLALTVPTGLKGVG